MRGERRAFAFLRTHSGYLALAALIYSAGIVLGSLAIPGLLPAQRADLSSYLEMFIKGMTRDSPLSSTVILHMSLLNNLKTALLVWVLGITVIGAPLVVLVLFIKGFVTGFTVGFLSAEMGSKGIFLATVSIVPHSLIAIPALVLLSVASFAFASALVKQSLQHRKVAFMSDLLAYTCVGAAGSAAFLLASLVEAYITPALLRWLSVLLA